VGGAGILLFCRAGEKGRLAPAQHNTRTWRRIEMIRALNNKENTSVVIT
jgi:hypothetical protein